MSLYKMATCDTSDSHWTVFVCFYLVYFLTCHEGTCWGAAVGNCPDDWAQYEGYCYKMSSTQLPCWEAEGNCKESGAHLASIHSQKENIFIQTISNHAGTREVWIGLFKNFTMKQSMMSIYERREGWGWTDSTEAAYTPWRHDEPSGLSGENCARLDTGELCDTYVSDTNYYVCKKPLVLLTDSPITTSPDIGNRPTNHEVKKNGIVGPRDTDNKHSDKRKDRNMEVVYICAGVVPGLVLVAIVATVVVCAIRRKKKSSEPSSPPSYVDNTVRSTAKLTTNDIYGPLPGDYDLAKPAGWEYQEIDTPGGEGYEYVRAVSGYDDTPGGDHYKRFTIGGHPVVHPAAPQVNEGMADYEEMDEPVADRQTTPPEADDYDEIGASIVDNVVYDVPE